MSSYLVGMTDSTPLAPTTTDVDNYGLRSGSASVGRLAVLHSEELWGRWPCLGDEFNSRWQSLNLNMITLRVQT